MVGLSLCLVRIKVKVDQGVLTFVLEKSTH